MDRRDFIKNSVLGIAGAIVGGGILGGMAGAATGCVSVPTKKRMGLQLYSLRDAMRDDPKATLAAVAAMGYTDLETASYDDGGRVYGFTPAEFRKMAEDLGMKITSCHIGAGGMRSDQWWAGAISDHEALGCKYVIVPSFRLGKTLEEIDEMCDYFNRVSEMCKARGMVFGYHNHSAEFKSIGDRVVYDHMLARTSPDVVFELDVYWAKEGGADPVAYFNKYPGRFTVIHIKDDDIIGASGKIDFEAVFNAAYAAGMRDWFVEVERYPLPPEVCVSKSLDFLEVAPYVK